MKLDNDAIIEMCTSIDLLDYASQSCEFTKQGDSYFTNCSKHVDLTPSLSITPSKNLFHCFSCGISGNIINWIIEFEGLSFINALEKVAKLSNVDISNFKQSESMRLFKNLKRQNEIKLQTFDRRILDESTLDMYKLETPNEWVEEGIDPFIMFKYNIRIDDKVNRIIYPIYDKDFNLIGIKGRTRYKNYKEIGIKKYQNYHKIGTTDFFVGMKENKDSIIQKQEAIIFEGIKSGMKAEAWGYDNWLSSETSYLNDEQVKILIQLKIKDIVIAFDTDVDLIKIKECTKVLRKFTNVFYIYDKKGLLTKNKKDDKLSPVDKDRDIWEILYQERVKIK